VAFSALVLGGRAVTGFQLHQKRSNKVHSRGAFRCPIPGGLLTGGGTGSGSTSCCCCCCSA
jgi:hypothetical protein